MSVVGSEKDTGYRQGPWDLSDLLPSSDKETLARNLGEIETTVAAIEAARDELAPEMEPARFLAIVRLWETLVEQMSVVGGYAGLWFAADTQSQEATTFRNRVEQALTAFENRVLFLDLWWKGLNDDEAERLLPAPEEDADLRAYLEEQRRFKPYTLAECCEKTINLKDANGIQALLTVYSMLTNRLEFALEVDGETKKLTRDQLMRYAFSPRPELRQAAYEELHRVFGNEKPILAQIYINRVRDWADEGMELRGFASPIAMRNLANDVPDAAVEALLSVARKNSGVFQRYFRLKASWLGIEKLRRYDLYAPLPGTTEREIGFPDAAREVLDTFAAFHPRFAAAAERVFAETHLDSEIRHGKKGGAFCSTIAPRFTPWVLVNYTGRPRDVAVLAHELGHAVHSMMAEGHSVLTQHSCLPLAETASVFAEMLMTDRLLEREGDPLARRELLAASLDDIYATVLRQAYFTHFEVEAHAAIAEGASPDELERLYRATLDEQFGDSMEVAPEFAREWLSIPHIYQTPFYCYAYSFGQLLVLALYRRFQEEGEAFKPTYLRLLAWGGAARPEKILSEAGVDMTDPAFWQNGFDLIADRVTELEQLPAK